MMDSCKTCAHRKYDNRWGGPMCKIYKHSVKDADRYLDCKKHKKKYTEEDKK